MPWLLWIVIAYPAARGICVLDKQEYGSVSPSSFTMQKGGIIVRWPLENLTTGSTFSDLSMK
jgi:hypothetical protein